MNIKWYPGELERLDDAARKALEMAGEAVRTDLLQEQTLPFAEDSERNRERGIVPGELQGSVFVDRSEARGGKVSVVANTPYARRLYFHPEYNYYRGTNKMAGGEWFKPYMEGRKKEWLQKSFASLLRRAYS